MMLDTKNLRKDFLRCKYSLKKNILSYNCMSMNARKGKNKKDDEFYNILQKVQ